MVAGQDSDNKNELRIKSVYILKVEPRGFAEELIERLERERGGLKLTTMI